MDVVLICCQGSGSRVSEHSRRADEASESHQTDIVPSRSFLLLYPNDIEIILPDHIGHLLCDFPKRLFGIFEIGLTS